MKKTCQLFGGMILAGLLFASPVHAQVCGTPMETPLVAGQHYYAGTVRVFNDNSNIYVQYMTDSPWILSEAHAAVAATLQGLPQTKNGNPMPGRFAYSATFDPEVTNYTFVVPSSGVFAANQAVYVAAHAVVQAPRSEGGSQTGWGYGQDFPGANWATYMTYNVQSCGGGGGGID
ncbi:MAG TPA: hypothetical protein VFS23_24970 [Vicinamibacterales bacterium]|nr:hypothetical protein [Vicinamibacterales bacterium]